MCEFEIAAIAVAKLDVLVSSVEPFGQSVVSELVDTQTVFAPANTVLGSCTTISAQLFVTVFVPSVTDNVTVYWPGLSNTCEAIGPRATLRLLVPGRLPVLHVVVAVPLSGSGEPAGSLKSQRYSRSWNGVGVAGIVTVPEASKNTDKGATPMKRLGTVDSEMALVAPVVEQP